MSAYNTVTVTGFTGTRDELNELFENCVEASDTLDLNKEGDSYLAEWHTKWDAEGIPNFVEEVQEYHPGANITWSNEWNASDADEPGQEIREWVAGVEVPGKEMALVPANLSDLIKTAQAALDSSDRQSLMYPALDALVKAFA